MAKDLFAPVTPEELTGLQDIQPAQTAGQPSADLFAPVTKDELKGIGSVSQPPDTVVGAQSQGPRSSEQSGDQPSAFERFVSGVKLGAQETINPDDVTKEDLTREKDMWEAGGEIVGAIGTDLAAAWVSAKVGAAVGTAVFPGVGTAVGGLAGLVGYGIYSGIQGENLAEKRTGEFSTPRAIGRVALSINPMLRYGGKLSSAAAKYAPKLNTVLKATEKVGSRVARVGLQAAGESAVAGSEFGKDGAILAAVASLGIHGLAFKSGMDINPMTSRVIGEASEEAGAEAVVRANKIMQEMSPDELTFSPDKIDAGFARFVNRSGAMTKGGVKSQKKGIAAAKRILDTVDEETQQGMWQDWILTKTMGREMGKINDELGAEFAKRGSLKAQLQSTEDFHTKVVDGLAAVGEMDRTAGTGATEVLNGLAEARGMYENLSPLLLKKGIAAQKLTKKARMSNKQMGQLRVFLSEGKQPQHLKGIEHLVDADGNVAGKVKTAVDAWSDAFDEGYNLVKAHGFDPNHQDYYVPRQMLGLNEKTLLVEDYTRTLGQLSGRIDKPNLRTWNLDDLESIGIKGADADNIIGQIKDLRKINVSAGGERKSLTMSDLGTLKGRLLDSKNTYRMGNDVSAVFSKGNDDFSDALREFDISKTFLGYVNGSVKSAIMSKATRKAYGQHEAFALAGMPKTAQWWGNLLQDLSGDVRGETRQFFLDKGNRIKYQIFKGMQKEEKNIVEAVGWNTANLGMKMFEGWQTAVYPAYLGLNAKATIRNIGQNWVQTAPWMGGTYGLNVVARSSASNFFKHTKRMKADGLLAAGFKAEALSHQTTKAGRAYGRLGDISMKFYELSDNLNRMVAYNAGHVLARDLSRGSADALQALEKMGPGVRLSLRKAGLTTVEAMRADMDKVGDIIGKHTVARTQFHYGVEQKAEFLRTMGPMFSMFTKWPVSIASDFNTIWRENPKAHKAALRMFERYGAPLAAFATLQSQIGDDDQVYNALIGDIKSWAPVMSVLDMGILNNPAIEAAMSVPGFFKAIIEDPSPATLEDKVKKATQSLMKSTVPVGSSILNEADRWRKADNKPSLSSEMVDELFD
jgi:hypothetical protein